MSTSHRLLHRLDSFSNPPPFPSWVLNHSWPVVLPLAGVDNSETFLKCFAIITASIFHSQTPWRALSNSPERNDSWALAHVAVTRFSDSSQLFHPAFLPSELNWSVSPQSYPEDRDNPGASATRSMLTRYDPTDTDLQHNWLPIRLQIVCSIRHTERRRCPLEATRRVEPGGNQTVRLNQQEKSQPKKTWQAQEWPHGFDGFNKSPALELGHS